MDGWVVVLDGEREAFVGLMASGFEAEEGWLFSVSANPARLREVAPCASRPTQPRGF